VNVTPAQLRKLLQSGVEFDAEFRPEKIDSDRQRRRVVSCNSTRLISVFLTGPRIGQEIELAWKGAIIEFQDGWYCFLAGKSVAFRFRIVPPYTPYNSETK
jgi:hypothetical protein